MGNHNTFNDDMQNYKIKYSDSRDVENNIVNNRKIAFQKGKIINVKLFDNNVEKILWEDSNLTVGWLLSEVTRRYNRYFELQNLDPQ